MGIKMEQDLKNKVKKRLKTIQGHIGGILKMVEEEKYCIDILKQSQAVCEALKKVDGMILDNHLKTCLTRAVKKGESKKAFSELLEVFEVKK